MKGTSRTFCRLLIAVFFSLIVFVLVHTLFHRPTHVGSSPTTLPELRHVSYPFKSYNPSQPLTFRLREDTYPYYTEVANRTCFVLGTDLAKTHKSCECFLKWIGQDCSVPESVWASPKFRKRYLKNTVIRRKQQPRRVINALNFNHELDMLEIRLNELYFVVDVFVICESNYTALGEPKPLILLSKLRKGFLKEFQDKIVYVWLDHFPQGGKEDGWLADGYIRTFLWQQGKKQLSGLRGDDLFVLTDADEIPRADIIAFLKTHDGYGFPISWRLRWTVYGFFWLSTRSFVQVHAACTTKYLSRALGDNAYALRTKPLPKNATAAYGEPPEQWTIGLNKGQYAGWHCSWCFTVDGIRFKLKSAQSDDGPRWGNFPEKLETGYIMSLVRTGLWFDGTKRTRSTVVDNTTTPMFVLKNADRFAYLTAPPLYQSVLTNGEK